MNIEKSKISLGELFGASNYVRLGILISVSIIFTILLYPNLVIKEQTYRVGDVARGIEAFEGPFGLDKVERDWAMRVRGRG